MLAGVMPLRNYLLTAVLGIAGVSANAALSAQARVSITQIAGQASLSGVKSLGGRPVDVRGRVFDIDDRTAADYRVQLALARGPASSDRWQILGTARLEPLGQGSAQTEWGWTMPNFQLPAPDEYGSDIRLSAVLVRRQHPLPERHLLDYATIERTGVAISDGVDATVLAPEPAAHLAHECSVDITEIRDMYGEMKSLHSGSNTPVEVTMITWVIGKADRPPGSEVVLVIQSMTDNRRWVMEPKGLSTGRDFSETAYFGNQLLNLGEVFRVKAVVVEHPINPGPYSAERWRGVEAIVCASSREIRARRRSSPRDLVVSSMDDDTLAGLGRTRARMEARVSGGIEDPQPENAIKPSETVWLLIRPSGGEPWVTQALGFVSLDRLSWRVPSLRFPAAGDFDVMAVATEGGQRAALTLNQPITEDGWYRLVRDGRITRLSRIVRVTVDRDSVRKP
jgi:hypothetical protein